MKKSLVSIVLPIYNVEKYLERCMQSVVNQTFKDLEIIMVDDGSTDSCPKMCDEWAMKDSRIKVIHKKNAGLGMARNTGIENATGEYICFWDSDDFVALDAVELLYKNATMYNADVVVYGYHLLNQHGEVTCTRVPTTEKNIYTDAEVLEKFLPDLISKNPHTGQDAKLWMSSCGAMFSTNLINNVKWRFVSEREIISEDVYSLLLLYQNVSAVCVMSQAFYNYCENDTNSLTRTFKGERYTKNKYFYEACIEACERLGYSKEIQSRISYQFLGNTLGAMKRIAISDYKLNNKIAAIREIIYDRVFCAVTSEMKTSKETFIRKVLFYYIKKKDAFSVFLLIYLQAKRTLR